MTTVPAAISVDFEFFTHLPAYRSAAGTTTETALGRAGVEYLLEAFDDADALGTFFTVSSIADDHPDLVEQIGTAGHEVGSHTHTHRHLSELTPTERRDELTTSRERLEAVTGTEVVGFRAPSFDFGDDHFDLLDATGYEYDSSVVPSRSIPGWYGGEYDVGRPVRANAIREDAPDGLREVPVAVMPGLRLPLTGTWIRFFGVSYTVLGMRLLARRGILPVLYVHPWELVDLPAVEGVPARVYVRTGEYMRRAVSRILSQPFEFVQVRTVADRVDTTDGRGTDAGDEEARR